MTLCYFGFYAKTHPRNSAFLAALHQAGYQVEETHEEAVFGLAKYVRLATRLYKRRRDYGAVIVGFPGPQSVILVRLLYRGPIIYNALVSQYDAATDRGVVSRWHPYAWYLWLLDFTSGHLATKIIFDCDAYSSYYAKTFFLSKKRFARIFQSADEAELRPIDVEEERLTVHYYGGFTPSHGVDTIVRAAKIVEKEGIRFVLSGDGSSRPQAERLARDIGADNVRFSPHLSTKQKLNEFIRSSWVSLGLFSRSPKADRAIATKVMEALYCERPVVTVGTTGTHELLTDGVSALLVPPEDPQALAQALVRLKEDDELRRRVADAGKKAYQDAASLAVAAEKLAAIIVECGIVTEP